MRKTALGICVCLVGPTWACAGAPPPAAVAPEPAAAEITPEERDALYAREAMDVAVRPVPLAVLEGRVSGVIESTATPSVKSEENDQGELVTVVEAPIGTGSPMSCIFRQPRLEPGLVLQQMLSPVVKAQGGALHPEVGVRVAAGVPVLTVTAPFVEDRRPMLAKVAIAASDGGTVLCTHFEAGYKATFAQRVDHLVASLHFPDAPTKARWHEVRVLEKGTSRIFLERDVFDTDKSGQLTARDIVAGFIEADGGWLGLDGISNETFESRSGAVIEKTSALAFAGRVVSEVKLTRKRPLEYAYEGKQKDGPIQGTFHTKASITTTASRAAQLRSWVSGRGVETRFLAYDELENVKGATELVVRRAEGRTVTFETRGAKVETSRCAVDANGLCENEITDDDGSHDRRLFSRGSL
jgi:hypothetical protein